MFTKLDMDDKFNLPSRIDFLRPLIEAKFAKSFILNKIPNAILSQTNPVI